MWPTNDCQPSYASSKLQNLRQPYLKCGPPSLFLQRHKSVLHLEHISKPFHPNQPLQFLIRPLEERIPTANGPTLINISGEGVIIRGQQWVELEEREQKMLQGSATAAPPWENVLMFEGQIRAEIP